MTNSNNIAMVVYSQYSRDARVRRYAESLDRYGYKVDIICLNEEYNPKYHKIHLIKYPIERKRAGWWWYAIEYFLFFFYTFTVLSYRMLIKRYQLIHVNNMPDFLVFTAIIPKLLGTKVVLDMHDPMPELYMSKYHENQNCFIVRLLKLSEKLSFRFADKILTANEAFKTLFLKRAPFINNKIGVILNCPDRRIFNGKQKILRLRSGQTSRFNLFYMGTVEERFGLDIVFNSLVKLVSKISNLRFIIIPKLEDEGIYFRNLKSKIENSKLKNHIRILTPQSLEKIASHIGSADIGIVLAKNGVFTENIFPVKLLEFVQMGIPVIATKTKVLGENFSGDQIYFLKKNTPTEFQKAVCDLYRNRAKRIKYAINAQKYLKANNWMKEEKKYLNIIRTLTES